MPEALDQPEFPEDARYVWEWFCRLSSRRQVGMGPGPLTWPQIESFFRVLGIDPNEWEVRAIERLDDAWLGSLATGQAGQK